MTPLGIRAWLFGVVVAAALPTVALTGYVGMRWTSAESVALHSQLAERAEAMATAVERRLESGLATLMTLALSESMQRGDFAITYRHAQRLLNKSPVETSAIALTRGDGRPVFSTRRTFGAALPPADMSVLAPAVAVGKPRVSDLFTDQLSGFRLVSIDLPIAATTAEGAAGHVLRMALEPAILSTVLVEQRLPTGWIGVLLDRSGTIIARTQGADDYVGQKGVSELLRAMEAGPRGWYDATVKEGNVMRAYFQRLPSGWAVAVGAPAEAFRTPLLVSVRSVALGGGLLLLLGLSAAWLVARRLERQVTAAANAAVALGRGERMVAPFFPVPVAELALLGQALAAAGSLLRHREEEREQQRRAAVAAAARAERAVQAKSRFLAAASHDLRQPVQSLVLLLAVLRGRTADGPLSGLTATMEQALAALTSLLNGILDLSRLDAGAVEARCEAVALRGVLDRLVDEYRVRAAEKAITIRLLRTSVRVHTDPALLERVLRNLLENALRYTPGGERTDEAGPASEALGSETPGSEASRKDAPGHAPRARAARILVGTRRRGDMVSVDIIDTGVGIAPEHLEVIFDEFFQVTSPLRDRSRGYGLGLAIVERTVRLLGGRIEVASVLGRGSRFSVYLPVIAEKERPMPDPQRSPATARGKGEVVLVVDDDPDVLDGLRLLLELWGYRPEVTESGEEAIIRIERGCLPAAVIADYRMSGVLNGVETVLAVRAALGVAVPAVIMTGDTATDRVQELSDGGIGLLHKPVAPEALKQAIADLLAGRR